ncbi:unnamed protein product [Caenorhabditis sp. 36 PRJEB53466]|nr:unnamed protein product [Caenorhabditis sp. 36 PRJEB53466]
MSSLYSLEWSCLASQIGFVSTLTVNSFLVYLILRHTKQVFGAYKYLIVAFSVMGILFATAEFIVKPASVDTTVTLSAYSSTYAATISLLAVQFVYRYWAVFHTRRIAHFNGVRILAWVSVAMLFGVDWSSSVYFLGMSDAFSDEYLSAEFADKYNLNMSTLAYFAAVVYDQPEKRIRWRSVMVMVSVSKVVAIQYAVMIFCGTRMHRKMGEKLEQFSITNRRMHQQLFKTLVVQITVPTFVLFMPTMLMFLVPFFDWSIGVATGTILCALSLYPFIDGIIVICIVSDYRKATKEILQSLIFGITCQRVVVVQPQKYDISTSAANETIRRANRVESSTRFTASSF